MIIFSVLVTSAMMLGKMILDERRALTKRKRFLKNKLITESPPKVYLSLYIARDTTQSDFGVDIGHIKQYYVS